MKFLLTFFVLISSLFAANSPFDEEMNKIAQIRQGKSANVATKGVAPAVEVSPIMELEKQATDTEKEFNSYEKMAKSNPQTYKAKLSQLVTVLKGEAIKYPLVKTVHGVSSYSEIGDSKEASIKIGLVESATESLQQNFLKRKDIDNTIAYLQKSLASDNLALLIDTEKKLSQNVLNLIRNQQTKNTNIRKVVNNETMIVKKDVFIDDIVYVKDLNKDFLVLAVKGR